MLFNCGFPGKMIDWIRECISTPSYSVILNGQMHGFFKGQKGLRQGDPLSPYLFTLVMQMLSLMIRRRVMEEGNFQFHPKCAKQGITHLSFADDLFLFCAADPYSVHILKECLDEFGRCSGLWPNNGKSNVFFGNVSHDDRVLIQSILDFNVGTLPVRYLGVPLISTALWVNDCKPLVQKVRDKIDSWENKWLNYAGKVQLATSVLLSMQVYWSSIFLLPISVTKQIEKLIRGFIWGGKDAARGKAKVSWKDVCCPKQEGGLGLRSLRCWNKALMVYHIWNIVSEKCSLWVKWVHDYRLKRRSFWDIKVAWDASWSWKNILALREEVRPFIRAQVGDGQKTNFWFDSWVLDVPLSNFCSHRDIAEMGLHKANKVADFIVDGQWEWPSGLLLKVPQLQSIHPQFSERSDIVNWISKYGKKVQFSISQVWDDLRLTRSKVLWWHLVWFCKSIPKHCFTLWLAIRDRLLTQVRLKSWQVQQSVACSFCDMVPDSLSHLFFECEFCNQILVEFQRRGYLLCFQGNWEGSILYAAANWKGKSLYVLINKLVLAAVIFHIWQERNRRLFQKKKKRAWQISADITDDVRKKLQGLAVVNTSRVRDELSKWDIFVERPSIQT